MRRYIIWDFNSKGIVGHHFKLEDALAELFTLKKNGGYALTVEDYYE